MRLGIILTIALFSSASPGSVFTGPISRALGGGGRAGIQSLEAGLVNPALVPLIQASDMSAYFTDGSADLNSYRGAYGLGVVDAQKDVYFPAAAHYIRTRETGRASGPADGELWHAAAGKNISKNFAAGASVYRLTHEVAGDRTYTQWNYSIGLLAVFEESFGVGYVLANIAKPGSAVPAGLRENFKQGLGLYGSLTGLLKARADIARQEVRNPGKKLEYSVSLESMTSEWLLFRAGFRREELTDQRFWTAGLGFNGPRLKVDYSFEKNQERTSGAVHSVDLRVPF